jgi:Flp pilus assembly pilin Flp
VGLCIRGGPPSRSQHPTPRTTEPMNNTAANHSQIDPRSDSGQTMAEYSVLVGLIVLAVAAAVTVLNSAVLSLIGRVSDLFT